MQAFLVATIMGKVVDEIEAWGQAELCPKSIRVRKIQLVGFCVSGGFVAVRYSYIAASETYEIEKGRFSEHTKCEKCSITFPSGQAFGCVAFGPHVEFQVEFGVSFHHVTSGQVEFDLVSGPECPHSSSLLSFLFLSFCFSLSFLLSTATADVFVKGSIRRGPGFALGTLQWLTTWQVFKERGPLASYVM